MSNRSNIFSVLPQDHSDDEDTHGNQQSKKEKKQTNKKDTGKVEEKQAPVQKTQTSEQKPGKDDHKKKKQVPEPGQHPLDRQSGTGQPAFDRKFKKGGHGKGNVGNSTKENEEETKEEVNQEEEKPEEPAKPEGITLEEYYAQSSQSSAQSQIDQAKAKSVQDELTKELLSKKATLYVKNKAEEEKTVRKTAKANVDHHAALNTEHADLLNFRTGFVEREFRERKEGEKPSKPAPKKEEKTEETAPTEEKTEVVAEGEEAEKTEDKEKRGGNRGGYKGGNRGGNYKGKGGNRGGNNKGGQPKINVEDDSAFPKLG